MKEQGKNSQDQINEEEIDKLSEKEFRIKMIQNQTNDKNEGTYTHTHTHTLTK